MTQLAQRLAQDDFYAQLQNVYGLDPDTGDVTDPTRFTLDTGGAYRVFLFSVFDEFAVDLPVLFDRLSAQGRLFPRETALLAARNAKLVLGEFVAPKKKTDQHAEKPLRQRIERLPSNGTDAKTLDIYRRPREQIVYCAEIRSLEGRRLRRATPCRSPARSRYPQRRNRV